MAYPAGAVSANLEGADAAVLFLGLTPGSVGLAQANLRVPVIPSGDYRLTITVGGVPARTALVSVKSPPGTPPPGLPAGATCVSGLVDLVSYSRETLISEVAGEVGIGGTLLCSKCDFKAPVHPEIVARMNKAQVAGLPVDACFDGLGNINLMRLRQR